MTVHDPEGEKALGALVSLAKARDAAAETQLHDRFRPFLRRRLQEARSRRNWFWLTDIESAVQDVFAQFFKALREGKFTYEGQRRLEGFLVRTAFFVSMNLKDRAKNDRHLSIFDSDDGGLRFDVAAFADAVYDQLDRKACLQLFAKAVSLLNDSRREVIERTLLGQKVRQICEATDRTAASVSGLKFNAFVDLRKHLGTVGFMERCGELFNIAETAV